MKKYKLLGPDGYYESEEKGSLGGYRPKKIYGRLDCRSALKALEKSDKYAKVRVFFKDEATAKACGYRPCGNCMKTEYAAWKAEQAKSKSQA